MAVSCTAADLARAAACYDCLPVHMHLAVQTYLLNVISGLNLTPQQLAHNAACYKCLEGMQEEAQAYLLCQILNS